MRSSRCPHARQQRLCSLLMLIFAAVVVFGCAEKKVEPVSAPVIPAAPITGKSSPDMPMHLSSESSGSSDLVLADDWFEDTTSSSGIDFRYKNGQESAHYFILESLGGGAAVLDYDRDENVDVFLNGGGTISGTPAEIRGLPSALFRNSGASRFSNHTAESGLDTAGDYSHGCFVSDYDCDGFPDLLVTAWGRCRLFHNLGDGMFRDVTGTASLDHPDWSTGAAWGDIDRDGFPDLFVTTYLKWSPENDRPCNNADGERDVCGPRSYSPADDRVFRNGADGAFEDISSVVGLRPGGNGLGVVAAEINGDAYVDFYVANDETDNFLYLGQQDGTLTEVAHAAGVAVNQYGMHDGSMGVEAGDYDGDGEADLWVTNFELEDNGLYRNLGGQQFQQTTNTAGLAGRSRLHVGFGTAMEDFNNDGWLDLFVSNGHVFYRGGQLPYLQPPQLFLNTHNGRFNDVSASGGTYFRSSHSGRGAAVGDLDNDGALDLIIVHQNDPVSVLRNRHSSANFARLQLVGTRDHRDAVGAVVSVETGGRKIVRHIRNGAGFLSSFDPRIIIPVQTQTINVMVRWPNGVEEEFKDVPTGRTTSLMQGRGFSYVSP